MRTPKRQNTENFEYSRNFEMAAARLHAILACFGCGRQEPRNYDPDEKAALLASHGPRTANKVAGDVVSTLLTTSLTGPALHMQLDSVISACGWTENLAKRILEKLTFALQEAQNNLGPVISDAYRKVWDVARDIEGFVIEHPIMCTIIALGVLALVAPWVLSALGFGELGPIEGEIELQRFCERDTDNCKRYLCGVVGIHLWWAHPEGISIFFFPTIGYEVALDSTCVSQYKRTIVDVILSLNEFVACLI